MKRDILTLRILLKHFLEKKFGKKKILPIKLEKINNFPKDSSVNIKKLKSFAKI